LLPALEIWAEKYPHLLDKFQDTFVGNFVENEIGIFAVIDNPLTTQYIQVLGNVCVGGFNLLPDLAH
jgi:hypothetical protein